MIKVLCALAIGAGLGVAACTSSTEPGALQMPGETTRSGLQVPPRLGERPVQTATAPTGISPTAAAAPR
jgi:hypothetical protein